MYLIYRIFKGETIWKANYYGTVLSEDGLVVGLESLNMAKLGTEITAVKFGEGYAYSETSGRLIFSATRKSIQESSGRKRICPRCDKKIALNNMLSHISIDDHILENLATSKPRQPNKRRVKK